METLTDELLTLVLHSVPPNDLILSASLVSKRFHTLIARHGFWQAYRLAPSEGDHDHSLNTHQLQRASVFAFQNQSRNDNNDNTNNQEPSSSQSLLLDYDSAVSYLRNDRRVCVASSTDHISESLENTLQGRQQQQDENRWWSSQPQQQDSVDTLLYAFQYPISILNSVRILPLVDPYRMIDDPVVYSWKTLIVRAYQLPIDPYPINGPPTIQGFPMTFPASEQFRSTSVLGRWVRLTGTLAQGPRHQPDLSDMDTISSIVNPHVPVYESDPIPMDKDATEPIVVPMPPHVICNAVSITLIGKHHEQFQGVGHYACVKRVDCTGIPLLTHATQLGDVQQAKLTLVRSNTNQ